MKIIWGVITLILILATLVLVIQDDEIPYSTSSKIAYDLFKQGTHASHLLKNDEAIILLNKSISEDPGFAMAHAKLSTILHNSEKDQEAEYHYEIADSLLNSISSELEKNKIRLEMSRVKEIGLASFDSLLASVSSEDPDDLMVMITQASVWASRKDDRAIDLFKKIIDQEPDYAPAYNLLGYTSASVGKYDEAENYFKHYSFLAPDIANPHDSLGDLLTWTGRYEEAEIEYLTALELQPDFIHSLIGIAKIQLYQGRVKAATELLNRIKSENLTNRVQIRVNSLFVEMYLINEIYDDLEKSIDDLTDSIGSNENSYGWLSIKYALQGNKLKSNQMLEKLQAEIDKKGYSSLQIVKSGIENLIHQRNAILAEQENNYSESVEHWTKALAATDESAPHEKWFQQWSLGKMLIKINQPVEAAKQAQLILRTNPNNLQAWVLLADATIKMEDLPSAESALKSATTLMELTDTDIPVRVKVKSLRKKLRSLKETQLDN